MAWVDIGINLTHDSFAADRAAVLAAAMAVGVEQLVLTGTSIAESEQAAAVAATRPGVLYATAGVHPHDARHWDDNAAVSVQRLLVEPVVVAVGETGLDFNRNFSPPADQLRAFEAQLAIAAETQLPVFLHQRDAHEAFMEIMTRWRPQLSGGVVHCFTGTREEMAAYLALDLHIGITGWICDERRGLHLQEAVVDIPDGRLMLETDAPYLLPRTLKPRPKSRRNEPAYLPVVADTVARCRGCTLVELAATTTATAQRFFGLAVV